MSTAVVECAECAAMPESQQTVCEFCHCCMHTPANASCKVNDAAVGMRCPNAYCGCEGQA